MLSTAVRVHVARPVLDTSPKKKKDVDFWLDFLLFFSLFSEEEFLDAKHSPLVRILLRLYFYRRSSGDNFSAPMRDDSETFKNSLAGQSNWNAYEGGDEKPLTPEEKKAKNAKEDAEAAARRAASAAKMAAERKAAGA